MAARWTRQRSPRNSAAARERGGGVGVDVEAGDRRVDAFDGDGTRASAGIADRRRR